MKYTLRVLIIGAVFLIQLFLIQQVFAATAGVDTYNGSNACTTPWSDISSQWSPTPDPTCEVGIPPNKNYCSPNSSYEVLCTAAHGCVDGSKPVLNTCQACADQSNFEYQDYQCTGNLTPSGNDSLGKQITQCSTPYPTPIPLNSPERPCYRSENGSNVQLYTEPADNAVVEANSAPSTNDSTCLYDNPPFDPNIANSSSSNPIVYEGYTYNNGGVGMWNNGGTQWTSSANYNLGSQDSQDNTNWGLGRVALPTSIPWSDTYNIAQADFAFSVTAPSTAGTYNFDWQMVKDGTGGQWFGAICKDTVTVIPPISGWISASTNTVTQGNSISFTAGATDADGTLDSIRIFEALSTSDLSVGSSWTEIPTNCSTAPNSLPFADTSSQQCTGSYTWNTPGTYDVVVNAYSSSGAACSGNPSLSSGFVACGPADMTTVTITAPVPPPSCDSTPVCTGACTAPSSCSSTTGTQSGCTYTTYSGGGTCTQVSAPDQSCTNTPTVCSSGYSCVSGTCTSAYIGSLQVVADSSTGSQAKGSYGASGMRSDTASGQTGSNYYNALLVTQNVNNTTAGYYLTGTAFGENPAANPAPATLKQLMTNADTNGVDGFILIYANCPTATCTVPGVNQTFTQGNFYVYFNGQWSNPTSTPNIPYIDNGAVNSNTKLEVNIPQNLQNSGTNNPPAPDFSVFLYHALGNHTWTQYGYLDDLTGKETVTQEPACDTDTPTAHCTSSLPLARANNNKSSNVSSIFSSYVKKVLAML